MKHRIKTALIIANAEKPHAPELIDEISRFLDDHRVEVRVIEYRRQVMEPAEHKADIAFSLGGDGTVLSAARLISSDTPLLAVNLGSVGFITEVGRAEWRRAYDLYCRGQLGLSRRIKLSLEVFRSGRSVGRFTALNDAVISSGEISRIIRLQVAVDRSPVGQYRADGVIVATPTGSTAYSAAAGGPILDPAMEAMVVNPICPFTLSNRPLVVPGSQKVRISVDREQRADVILTVDGQTFIPLEPGDEVCFSQSDRTVALIQSDRRDFYEVLRTKLNWSGGPDA